VSQTRRNLRGSVMGTIPLRSRSPNVGKFVSPDSRPRPVYGSLKLSTY